jgi:hypothetical protein
MLQNALWDLLFEVRNTVALVPERCASRRAPLEFLELLQAKTPTADNHISHLTVLTSASLTALSYLHSSLLQPPSHSHQAPQTHPPAEELAGCHALAVARGPERIQCSGTASPSECSNNTISLSPFNSPLPPFLPPCLHRTSSRNSLHGTSSRNS